VQTEPLRYKDNVHTHYEAPKIPINIRVDSFLKKNLSKKSMEHNNGFYHTGTRFFIIRNMAIRNTRLGYLKG